jgi:chromatin structure-remodeling complex subunit RSC1/2
LKSLKMSEQDAEVGSGPPPEPVKSIEEDAKLAEPANQVTDEQWKAMMDVVMGIYDYREEE